MKKGDSYLRREIWQHRKDGQSVGSRYGNQGVKVDCVKADEADVYRLVEYDFLAIGGPTHGFGASKPIKVFLEKLRSGDIKGKKVFAFDTKLKGWRAGSAAKRIEKTLKELGTSIMKPHCSAIVKAVEGALKEGMEEMFEQIGGEMQN